MTDAELAAAYYEAERKGDTSEMARLGNEAIKRGLIL